MLEVFRVENINQFEEKYRTDVRPTNTGGCMRAVYIGLEALYGEHYKFRGTFFKKFWRQSRRKEKKRKETCLKGLSIQLIEFLRRCVLKV